MSKNNRDRSNFLSDFLGGRKIDPSKLSKHTIIHDKWDAEEYAAILKEMAELNAAEDRLTDVADTGGSMFADMFFALVKANIRGVPGKEIRPTHQINRLVRDEALELKEYQEMRTYTVGDPIGAGLANIAMEPDLEILFDKNKKLIEQAEKLQQMMQQMAALDQEQHDLEEMMAQAAAGEGEGMDEGEAQNFQERQDLIDAAKAALQAQIEAEGAEFQEALEAARANIKQSIKDALKAGINDAKEMESLSSAWGLDPGSLHRLPANERIEMAKKLNTDKFKRIAQLIGPMHRMAMAEQQRKTVHSRDEVYDVSKGNDVARLLPMELLMLDDPIQELEFYRRFIEGDLLQYELRGTERLAKGGIVFCEDGSGSMSGDREIWAKAVGLCLMQIAKAQNRSFYGIHFGGPGTYHTFDFRDPKKITVDDVIEFAEMFYGGGTDFMTPLSAALDIMREEFKEKGCVKGDIVFATDGMCGVDQKWLDEFKMEQERLGFRVYGIVIGGNRESEPLYTIADHRVFTIANLINGDDIREIFRGV